MSVEITGILKHSPAHKAKIQTGDCLVSVNDHEIEDVLDYMFYSAEDKLVLNLIREGQPYTKTVIKSEYDDLGLEFKSFLMDDKRSCCNKCIFCFIDQMPPGMRETLYFKDDDARLSFLQGNYVTLTNLNDKDIERIINMRLNVNVSVHTTNPELRCKMMNNRFAGEKLRYLKMMADSGLQINCQIVCCPDINDGKELKRTLTDLKNMMPNIQSVAVVPLGLTKFREGLFPLHCFDKQGAGNTIDIIEDVQKACLAEHGTRMVFAADEFFLLAERPLPSTDYYEDYPQYENGIGLMRSLIDEFDDAVESSYVKIEPRKISIATGMLAGGLNRELVAKAKRKWDNLDCNVYPIINNYFGETITVAGLVTGGDLISQLRGKDLGTHLLIPKVMIKSDEPIFLDDITVSEVEKELGVKVVPTANNGYEYLDSLLGIEY